MATAMHEERFNVLYQQFYSPIYGYLLKKTHNHEQAEDLAQEVFIRMYKKFNGEHASAFLYRVAGNLFIDVYRKEKKTPFLTPGEMNEDMVRNIPDEKNLSLEEVATMREVQARLGEFCENRRVVVSLLCQGYSQQEVAERLGVSTAVVKTRWYRVLCELREEAA